jgi:cell division protein FtsW
LLPVLIIIAITIIPILFEPDLGTAIMIFSIACTMLFVSEINLFHLAGLGISALAVILFDLVNYSYQKNRILSFIDTVRGVREPSWQVLQSLICFSNSGFWGVGLGNSKQKLHFLPQPFTDFIFSIISEETGFIGAFIVLLLFLGLLWRGIWIALNAPDQQGKLLAIGITTSIIFYAFASVAIAVNLLPITGLPLPFISYGGSSLVMHFIAIGILLNISRQGGRKPAFAYNAVFSKKRSLTKSFKKRKKFAKKI